MARRNVVQMQRKLEAKKQQQAVSAEPRQITQADQQAFFADLDALQQQHGIALGVQITPGIFDAQTWQKMAATFALWNVQAQITLSPIPGWIPESPKDE